LFCPVGRRNLKDSHFGTPEVLLLHVSFAAKQTAAEGAYNIYST
jgi:hypothetical protein